MPGYFYYGVVLKVFGADPSRRTPAYTREDGVDFVPLSWPSIFLIKFPNIAGLGPIYGAIPGALYGPAAFQWIVLGSIFAGGVQDYFSGMLSIHHEGKSISEIDHKKYLPLIRSCPVDNGSKHRLHASHQRIRDT